MIHDVIISKAEFLFFSHFLCEAAPFMWMNSLPLVSDETLAVCNSTVSLNSEGGF